MHGDAGPGLQLRQGFFEEGLQHLLPLRVQHDSQGFFKGKAQDLEEALLVFRIDTLLFGHQCGLQGIEKLRDLLCFRLGLIAGLASSGLQAFGQGALADLFRIRQGLSQNFLGHLLGAFSNLFHIAGLGFVVPIRGGRAVQVAEIAELQAVNDPAKGWGLLRQGLLLRCRR